MNEDGSVRLPPDTDTNLGYLSDEFNGADGPLSIVIADADGCIVLELTTTLRRFREEEDATLTITANDLPPPEQRTECDPALAG